MDHVVFGSRERMAFKTCCGTIPPQREIWFADTETSQSQRVMHSDLSLVRGCPSRCHGSRTLHWSSNDSTLLTHKAGPLTIPCPSGQRVIATTLRKTRHAAKEATRCFTNSSTVANSRLRFLGVESVEKG